MALDLDVDALCAELDDILDQPAAATKRGGGGGSVAARPVGQAFGSASSAGRSTASRPPAAATSTSAFDLSDSDDEPAPRSKAAAAVASRGGAFASRSGVAAAPASVSATASRSSVSNNFDDSDDEPAPRSTATGRAAPAASRSAARPAQARSGGGGGGGNDSDDDLANLLADMDSAIDTRPSALRAQQLNTRPAPAAVAPASRAAVSSFAPSSSSSSSGGTSSSFGSGSKTKCYPPVLSSGAPGQPRSCASLLCVACDQRVICLRHARWKDGVVDYMFFRNHYPDPARMRQAGGVDADHAAAAYACACCWQTINDGDTLDLANMRTSGRQHEGCSARGTLKWVCTGC